MTLHRPLRTGSTEHEPAEVVFEILAEVQFDPRLSADDLAALQDELWRRLNETIRKTVGRHVHQLGEAMIRGVHGRGETSPLFPLVAGDARYTCALDIVEQIETLCRPTALSRIAYDARGRAYELDVTVQFIRRAEHDGQGLAELPEPGAVERAAPTRRGGRPPARLAQG
jgi:hypothetical protein